MRPDDVRVGVDETTDGYDIPIAGFGELRIERSEVGRDRQVVAVR